MRRFLRRPDGAGDRQDRGGRRRRTGRRRCTCAGCGAAARRRSSRRRPILDRARADGRATTSASGRCRRASSRPGAASAPATSACSATRPPGLVRRELGRLRRRRRRARRQREPAAVGPGQPQHPRLRVGRRPAVPPRRPAGPTTAGPAWSTTSSSGACTPAATRSPTSIVWTEVFAPLRRASTPCGGPTSRAARRPARSCARRRGRELPGVVGRRLHEHRRPPRRDGHRRRAAAPG